MKPILITALLMAACVGCRTSQVSSTPALGTVVRLTGDTRYSNDLLGWNDAKIGATLQPGAVIQTSGDASVHVELGPTRGRPHVVYLRENAVLKIDQLGDTNSATIQLRLRSGSMRNYVMPMADNSFFEAGTSNLLVRTRGGVFYLDVSGAVHVSAGSAVVLGTGDAGVRQLAAGQCYNPKTGTVTEWDMSAYAEHDIWPPKQTKKEAQNNPVQQTDEMRERNNSLLWGTPPRRTY